MALIFSCYIFIIGLVLGSFYTVVGLRVPLNKPIIVSRSTCPKCDHILTSIQLIPLISYLMQLGRCRVCKTQISLLYPTIELMTGLLFVLAFYILGWHVELIIGWTFISLLIIVVVSDLKYMIIPDKVLIIFAVTLLLQRIAIAPLEPWWDSLLGAAVGYILLMLIIIASKGGMGGGDMKLFGVIGIVVGWKLILVDFFLSTLIGSIYALIGLYTGLIKKKEPFPFAPAIVGGSLLTYFWGESFINWYVAFIIG